MKHKLLTRIGTVLMALCLMASLFVPALAADVADATIDTSKTCSLTLYKYDFTNATKDGVWDGSYVTTGQQDANVERILGKATRVGDQDGDMSNPLENGNYSNGYAIKGVEFSYLRVADIVTFTESVNDQHPDYNLTQILCGFDKVKTADLLTALGLGNGAGRYVNADNTDKLDHSKWYYTSDTLNAALSGALANDLTATKNALESYILANRGTDASVGGAMPLTSQDGWTNVTGLKVGLYLLVETQVPEMVTSTTSPFFLSLPMTSVDGGYGQTHEANVTTGGHDWIYSVTLYPKNETGIVTLEKTLRESKADTGKHNGSTDDITDGYSHNATASAGDVIDYQIISTLPTITSAATNISVYSFRDTLSQGLTYVGGDVKMEWYTDKDCTNLVSSWDEDSGMFDVAINGKANVMDITMTVKGLAEINKRAASAGNVNGVDYAGYSNYTLRITYTAKVNSDKSFSYGDSSNCNTVTLTWRRTSSSYYDTLVDDCHVYSFGMDLTKLFSDKESETAENEGLFDHVHFKVQNATDGYYVQAALNEAEGVYYVTGHTEKESQATVFIPVTSYPSTDNKEYGKIVLKGLEDDKYVVTELETANGYLEQKDNSYFIITAQEDVTRMCDVYENEAKLGVYQNDGHYYFEGCPDLPLANIPQVQLAHNLLTASAIADGNKISMLPDTDPTTGNATDSANALARVKVLNHPGVYLPPTGEIASFLLPFGGAFVVCISVGLICVLFFKKKKNEGNTETAN